MPTCTQTQSSLLNFNGHLSELLSESVVAFDTKEQVNFFLQFLTMFHALEHIKAWHFEGCDVEEEPDYESNCMRTVQYGEGEGYLVSLGEVTEEEANQVIGFDYFHNYEISITNGQIA